MRVIKQIVRGLDGCQTLPDEYSVHQELRKAGVKFAVSDRFLVISFDRERQMTSIWKEDGLFVSVAPRLMSSRAKRTEKIVFCGSGEKGERIQEEILTHLQDLSDERKLVEPNTAWLRRIDGDIKFNGEVPDLIWSALSDYVRAKMLTDMCYWDTWHELLSDELVGGEFFQSERDDGQHQNIEQLYDYRDEFATWRFPSLSILESGSISLSTLTGYKGFISTFGKDAAGIYIAFNGDRVFYVGMSMSLAVRVGGVSQHHKLKMLAQVERDAQVALIEYPVWRVLGLEKSARICPSDFKKMHEKINSLVRRLEAAAIKHYMPQFNG